MIDWAGQFGFSGAGLLGVAIWLQVSLVVVVGLFVVTMVLGLFGQRGRTEITPQREVALATGHADRRTVFENPLLQPIMWLLLVATRQIGAKQFRAKIREMLVAAGSPNFYTVDELLALAMLWGFLAAGAVVGGFGVFQGLTWAEGVIGFLFAFAGGFALAIYHFHTKALKRVKEISRRVPYTLDLIALAMGAGATFTEAVGTVVIEDKDHPFNVELNTVLAEIDLGNTRAQALRNLADRVPLEMLRSIVSSVIQAESLGTPLSDVLRQQASLLRLQRSVRAEKMAAAASVRILLPSVLILLSVVLAVFAPIIMRAIEGSLW